MRTLTRTLAPLLLVLLVASSAAASPAVQTVVDRYTFRNIAKAVSPAVVNIKVKSGILSDRSGPPRAPALPPGLGIDDEMRRMLEEFLDQQIPQMSPNDLQQFNYSRTGSGVIISPDGYVITSNHVIERINPADIEISMSDGRSFDKITIAGQDELTDLALLKIEASDLPTITWGNSDEMEVGDIVLAVGNPLDFNNSVSEGIISAKHRVIRKAPIEDLIQTTAMINPGNSGGALVNMDGELIGINMAIATSTGLWSGLGFAIPSKTAREVTDQIIARGKVARGYLGIEMERLNIGLARQMNYDKGYGIIVKNVRDESAAQKAGIQRYDIIARVNGAEIKDIYDMHRNIGARPSGSDVELEIFRDEGTSGLSKRLVKVTLDERPGTDELEPRVPEPRMPGQRPTDGLLGIRVEPSPEGKGVAVTNVERGSPAFGLIQEGDLILDVNRARVNSVEDFQKAVRSGKPDKADAHLFYVERNGEGDFVSVPHR